jgi:hypothetical protein
MREEVADRTYTQKRANNAYRNSTGTALTRSHAHVRTGNVMRISLFAFVLLLSNSAALASENYIGQWVEKPASCGGDARAQRDAIYTFHRSGGLAFPEFGCETARYRKTGSGWDVSASQCTSEDVTRAEPFAVQFKIRIKAQTIRLLGAGIKRTLLKCT